MLAPQRVAIEDSIPALHAAKMASDRTNPLVGKIQSEVIGKELLVPVQPAFQAVERKL